MAVYAKEFGYFFNSENGDRLYNANSFEGMLSSFFTNGVASGTLAVTACNPASMSVVVAPGCANINGKQAKWDSESVLTIEPPDGTYDRYDTIVIRRDDAERTISLDVVVGTPASSPQPTPPVREGNIYELVLARVRVNHGETSISNARITDRRGIDDECGIIMVAMPLAYSGAGYHNSIYRGKYLGSSVTEEQYAQIRAGTFDDLYIGDYWTFNNKNYMIADFDYWFGQGNSSSEVGLQDHHIVIVPDEGITNGRMESLDSAKGYRNSDFYKGTNGNTTRASLTSTISSLFGAAHILEHKSCLDGDYGGFDTCKVELMNMAMIFGTQDSSKYKETDKNQLALFRLDKSKIPYKYNAYWIRDVGGYNNSYYCAVGMNGQVITQRPSVNTYSLRPCFGIIG